MLRLAGNALGGGVPAWLNRAFSNVTGNPSLPPLELDLRQNNLTGGWVGGAAQQSAARLRAHFASTKDAA